MLIRKLKRKDLLAAIFYITVILIFCMATLFLFGTYFFERHFESPIHTHGKIILETWVEYDKHHLCNFLGGIALCMVMLWEAPKNLKSSLTKNLIRIVFIILIIFMSILAIHGLNSFISEPRYVTLIADNSTQILTIEGKPLYGDSSTRSISFEEINYIYYQHGQRRIDNMGRDDSSYLDRYGLVLIVLKDSPHIGVSYGSGDSGEESNSHLAQELSAATDKKLVCKLVDNLNKWSRVKGNEFK